MLLGGTAALGGAVLLGMLGKAVCCPGMRAVGLQEGMRAVGLQEGMGAVGLQEELPGFWSAELWCGAVRGRGRRNAKRGMETLALFGKRSGRSGAVC